MSKVIEEVRKISSRKLAEQQKVSENGYPKLIEEIKVAAERGNTRCEFPEYRIDQFSQRLLEQDGFRVYATTKIPDHNDYKYLYRSKNESIWVVSW